MMESRTWDEILPGRLAWEITEMERIAPGLSWSETAGAWDGMAPVWPFDRPEPTGLAGFLQSDRFELVIKPSAAHPAVPPTIWPIHPRAELEHCTDTAWHTNGDGSLCVVREHYNWTGAEPCAALVPTAAGWFLEFLLMTAGVIDRMTLHGIEGSVELDDLLVLGNRAANE